MSVPSRLHVVGPETEGPDGFEVEHHAHSWRRIVRQTFTDPRLESLSCRSDLYLVALDFAALCDPQGRGSYSSYARQGFALEERPDPSLCELLPISAQQVSRMLKILVALGLLRQVHKACMGRQAEYQTTIPPRGFAEVTKALTVAAELGFRSTEDADTRRRRTVKATEARKLRRAHEKARKVLDDASH